MRSTHLLGITILAPALMACSRGDSQVEEPVRRIATEENHLEESADSGESFGDTRPRETLAGQMPAPPPAQKGR